MPVGEFTPYSGVAGWMAALPSWVPAEEQERISSYQIYQEIYWTHPETFKLVLRGDEQKPVYLPNARTIVEAANRYVGKGLQVIPNPDFGTPNDRTNMMIAVNDLITREGFYSKYNSAKRFGLIRGDWMFHIIADEAKEQGKRISLVAIDPSSYFVVPKPDNPDSIWKIHLAEPTTNDSGEAVVRRQTYTRLDDGRIQTELALFKIDEWASGDKAAIQVIIPPTVLPDAIRAFPVYHIKNTDEPGRSFGSSELRGIERLFAAINQSATDEDIALAMEGLGLYATDTGGPVDEDGEDSDWIIGPGRVLENAGNFKRVNGLGSVQPYQDHISMMRDSAYEATGTSDVAIGKVDVQVAESGVALALRFSPMLAKAEEKDELIKTTMTQMWFDIVTMWIPSYEGMSFGEARPAITFGDKLPRDRDGEVRKILSLISAPIPILSAGTARKHLAKYGFEFDPNEEALVLQEMARAAEAAMGGVSSADGGNSSPGPSLGFDQRAEQELSGASGGTA